MEHWCRVIGWLRDRYADKYRNGDLRTRLTVHHAVCLLADMARQTAETAPAIPQSMSDIDWRGLIGMRVVLAHIPWRVESAQV